MDRKICASCYVVDFKSRKLLVVYNRKYGKWLQPGGHSEGEETPLETVIREVKEETGIDIIPIGVKFNNHVEPFAVEVYNTEIESMLDIQFIAIPESKVIVDKEGNNTRWVTLDELDEMECVDEELKQKFSYILYEY